MLRTIDQEKCNGCGSCFKACGFDVFRLATDQHEAPPCQAACPLGIDIRAYSHLLQQGRTREAAQVLLAENPFPALTSRLCPGFCQKKCARGAVDTSVNISGLEHYLGELVLASDPRPTPVTRFGAVAVIGSGPAALACACFLNRKGHAVTVFEAGAKPGGELCTPKLAAALPAQIAYLEKLGITFACGVAVGDGLAIGIEDLREQHFKAFVLATGAEKDKTLRAEPPFSSAVDISDDMLVVVNPQTLETRTRWVFAAGTLRGCPASVAHQIADGRRAADSVARYLNGWDMIESRPVLGPVVVDVPGKGIEPAPRLERAGEAPFAFEDMILEANRCLTCGAKAYAAFKDDCMTCYFCEMACPQGAIAVHPFKENLPRTISYAVEGVK